MNVKEKIIAALEVKADAYRGTEWGDAFNEAINIVEATEGDAPFRVGRYLPSRHPDALPPVTEELVDLAIEFLKNREARKLL